VGGFFVLARWKLASKSDQNKKKPNAAEQRMTFFLFLVGYKSISEGFFRR